MAKQSEAVETAVEFYEKRRTWEEYLCTHAGVSDRAFRVGWWLGRRMNGDDKCCWYSAKRIAFEMGRSVRYVRYGLAELRKANVLIVVEKPGKQNTFYLHAPFF